jgi:predicted RND superfamily exporter protein
MVDKHSLTLVVDYNDTIDETQIKEYVKRACDNIEEVDGINRVFVEEEAIEEADGEKLLEALLSVSKRELIDSLDSIQSMDKDNRQD